MSNKASVILITLILIASASGGVYFYTSNQFKPVKESLEKNVTDALNLVSTLEESLFEERDKANEQKQMIKDLEEEIQSLSRNMGDLEEEITYLTDENTDTKTELKKYVELSRHFYEVNPIRIGVTSHSSDQFGYTEDLTDKAKQDIQRYCVENDLPYRFDFEVGNNMGLDSMALANLITYDTLNINLVVGHPTDSQCEESLGFVNDNDMVMISSGSSSNVLADQDNLFRLASNDTVQLGVNLECIKTLGIEHVIICSLKTTHYESLTEEFQDVLTENNINSTVIRFSSNLNIDTTSQACQLDSILHRKIFQLGEEKVGVQLLGDGRLLSQRMFMSQIISDVVLLSIDDILDYEFEPGYDIYRSSLLLTPMPVCLTEEFIEFQNDVEKDFEFEVTYYGANLYDACWLYALSIIEAMSTDTEAIKEALPGVAANYTGVSGSCNLNTEGDRVSSNFRLMGYDHSNGGFKELGYYFAGNNTVRFTYIHLKLPSD